MRTDAKIEKAIDRLADLIADGHLMASVDPAAFLDAIRSRMIRLEEERDYARDTLINLGADRQRLQDRLDAMMPLFQEARDALCAITSMAAKLYHIRPDLADRMDAVGIKERWDATHPQDATQEQDHDD